MNPNIWGPYFWFILHIISFNYPKNPTQYDKQVYKDFFTSVKDILPCKNCKTHYNKYLQEYPITPYLDNKIQFIDWLINIHNRVNMSLGKQMLTRQQVIEIYKNINPISPFIMYNQNKVENNIKKKYIRKNDITNNVLYGLIFILFIIIISLKIQYNQNYYNY